MQKLGLLVVLVITACSSEPTKDSELAAASASAFKPQKPFVAPPGPILPVLAGQGLGPIRIGANAAVVERLMEHRCEVRSENLCRYVTRGVDFHFVGGILQWIHVQRAGRPAGKGADGEDVEFGFFKGVIPPDLRLGMKPEAVREYLGKPNQVEKAAEPNPQNTVWIHHYPGMVLEYDRWENGNLILAGIRITKDPSAVPAGAPDAGAPVDAGATDVAASTDAGTTAHAGARRPRKVSKVDHTRARPVREPEPR